jgi:uncharacterized membrane protein
MKYRTDFANAVSIVDLLPSAFQSLTQIAQGNWISLVQGNPTSFSSRKRATGITQSAVMSALVAVLTVTSVPLPPPLSAVTLAPAAIFVASIFLGPRVGLISGALGSAIGFAIATTVGTVAGASPGSALFPVFLLGIIVARGPEGYIIGTLRGMNEILAMILGTIYETLVFFLIDFFYTYPVLLGMAPSFAFLDLGTLIDLVFIVPAVGVLRCLRAQLGVRYYDVTGSMSGG